VAEAMGAALGMFLILWVLGKVAWKLVRVAASVLRRLDGRGWLGGLRWGDGEAAARAAKYRRS
jgi:hypothetical protein